MHARNLPRHAPILPKLDAEDVAADVVVWFGHCLRYLAPENWTFAVDADGKYLPGSRKSAMPNGFDYTFENWTFELRCVPLGRRVPHRPEELIEARERLHKVVTIVIMPLTSTTKTNKLLAKLREENSLKKLRRPDIM